MSDKYQPIGSPLDINDFLGYQEFTPPNSVADSTLLQDSFFNWGDQHGSAAPSGAITAANVNTMPSAQAQFQTQLQNKFPTAGSAITGPVTATQPTSFGGSVGDFFSNLGGNISDGFSSLANWGMNDKTGVSSIWGEGGLAGGVGSLISAGSGIANAVQSGKQYALGRDIFDWKQGAHEKERQASALSYNAALSKDAYGRSAMSGGTVEGLSVPDYIKKFSLDT